MEPCFVLVCNSVTEVFSKQPKTLQSVKKLAKQKLGIEKANYFVVNTQGCRIPVATPKDFRRAQFFAKKPLEVHVEVYSSSDEEEIKDSSPEPKKSHRATLANNLKSTQNFQEVPEDEMCFICYEKYQEPRKAKCGHTFCLECWKKLLASYLECPMCKSRVRLNHLKPVN